jgi:hypothetical protein
MRQLVGQLLLGVLHRADAVAGQGVDEGGTAEPRDLGAAALGYATELVPFDGGGDAKLLQ